MIPDGKCSLTTPNDTNHSPISDERNATPEDDRPSATAYNAITLWQFLVRVLLHFLMVKPLLSKMHREIVDDRKCFWFFHETRVLQKLSNVDDGNGNSQCNTSNALLFLYITQYWFCPYCNAQIVWHLGHYCKKEPVIVPSDHTRLWVRPAFA